MWTSNYFFFFSQQGAPVHVGDYAIPSDMLSRYDVRLLGDLVSDNGTQVTPTALLTNGNLQALLDDAYGTIISTIVVGNRYTLAQLTAANLSSTALQILKRLNCDLALMLLKQRRGKLSKLDDTLRESVDKTLKALQGGAEVLLGITDANAQAATIDLANPTLIPITQRDTIRFSTRQYFPVNYPYNGQQRQITNNGN